MRFMIIVTATVHSEADAMPQAGLPAAMAAYHDELARAGALLDGAGLQPSAQGWRVHYEDGRRAVVDGPHAGGHGSIAGYTLIQARSREEAVQWAMRHPCPYGSRGNGHIEVRQLLEPEDFAPRSEIPACTSKYS